MLLAAPDKVVDLLFTKYMEAPMSYEGIHRVERYPYPRAAVRELVCNALVHSNWARSIPVQISVHPDRMYVANQAILPRGLTVEKLLGKHRSEPYNPLIAQTLYRAGLIENWGRGIEKIRLACEAEGLPMAEFELDDSGVMACLMSAAADNKRTKETAGQGSNVSVIVQPVDNKSNNKTDKTPTSIDGLGKDEADVLAYLTEHPEAQQDDVAQALGMPRSTVANHTSALQRKGLLRREGSRKSGTWVVLIDGQDTPR